mmetsp:Transcript_16185/g.54396  ORF Transcript_16185/g.54396 Transcript_16185/m.54396 type:complete len:220 (-) Transcript_16185:264-923(-)
MRAHTRTEAQARRRGLSSASAASRRARHSSSDGRHSVRRRAREAEMAADSRAYRAAKARSSSSDLKLQMLSMWDRGANTSSVSRASWRRAGAGQWSRSRITSTREARSTNTARGSGERVATSCWSMAWCRSAPTTPLARMRASTSDTLHTALSMAMALSPRAHSRRSSRRRSPSTTAACSRPATSASPPTRRSARSSQSAAAWVMRRRLRTGRRRSWAW